uniref:Putative myosin-3 n=1 Tax=Panstrongylus lignarius TaxID=156445 RepID=A0A224XBB2_9HEMI
MNRPNLNLLNFELPQPLNCKYILTSPRSLKACRKAGVKPIELLYKSLSETERELGKKEGAKENYQEYEKERQRKLSICRKLRNDFILKGLPIDKYEVNKKEVTANTPCTKDGRKISVDLNIKGKYGENLRIMDNSTKNIENLESISSSPSDSKIENDKLPLEDEHIIPSSSPSKSPNTPEKSTAEIRSTPTISSPKNIIITPTNPNKDDILYNSGFVEKKSEENLENPGKLSIRKLDLVENNLNYANLMNTNEEKKEKMKVLETHRKGVHFEDFNNNHHQFLEKKPSLALRKKYRDKKKLKALEYERLYQNICAQYADPRYCLFKYKQVIENSLERELREQEVHRVQRELEEGLEKWQDDVLILQWLDSMRAHEQATKEIECKVEKLQRRARSKNILHTMNYNKVKRDEDMKAELLRRLVENKEKRIQNLHRQKARVICESKTRAQNISELKEQIRNILVPETFDKKVFKCGLQKKTLNTKAMCPRFMHNSHIRLA